MQKYFGRKFCANTCVVAYCKVYISEERCEKINRNYENKLMYLFSVTRKVINKSSEFVYLFIYKYTISVPRFSVPGCGATGIKGSIAPHLYTEENPEERSSHRTTARLQTQKWDKSPM